ncbi:PQQ-binding-like beta-propeller repeat protein [Steroidobacter flavus]|uniref:PQQ-binding-like beta-propeller repeat protein n=1 Tax=Steroidobacter flavus TaxID=1842136 RepID=A0ABV8T2N3_9GAMM
MNQYSRITSPVFRRVATSLSEPASFSGRYPRRTVLHLFRSIVLALFTSLIPMMVDANQLQNEPDDYAGFAESEWPLAGGDWSSTRYSKLKQINRQNVANVRGAWVSQKFQGGATSRVTPVVKNGLMFITAGTQVYALDAKSGESVWAYDTLNGDGSSEPLNTAIAGPNERGVAVGQGLVFVGLHGGHVIALEERTGKLVWIQQTGSEPPKPGQVAAVAPTYINGVILTGLSNGDAYLRGRLTALDADTGRILWQVFTIPGPGELGHQTWPSFNDTWKFGGGGVWTSAAVDPELSLVYTATGNAVPTLAGELRPGDNLFTCSVLAVDLKTGKVKWHYQLIRHDVFDGDAGTPVILYDATTENRSTRRALAVLRSDGYLFQLDRETGRPVSPIEERAVPQLKSQLTAPTQPFPSIGESILMSCDDWRRETIPVGFVLSCMWTARSSPPPSQDPQNVLAPLPTARVNPMAYSPQTGYFYAQGVSVLAWQRRAQDPYFFDGGTPVPGLKAYGDLAAIDGRTGKIAWKRRVPVRSVRGGPLVTAGGLMFRSGGGSIEAYDARNGDLLWSFYTGTAQTHGSPITYEIDGEQYVAVPVESSVRAFKLSGKIPPETSQPTKIEEQEDFAGPVVDTTGIETTSLKQTDLRPGTRYFIDEFSFNPYRARVRTGSNVQFVNNGNLRHELAAVDGSWSTGPLSPTQEAWVRFKRPGTYIYTCKTHPWSYGQIIVVSTRSDPGDANGSEVHSQRIGSGSLTEQAMRGREEFQRYCSACHGQDASGASRAPQLFGQLFSSRWRGAVAADLLERTRTTMPQSNPGALDAQVYLDIVAYILHANDMVVTDGEIREGH